MNLRHKISRVVLLTLFINLFVPIFGVAPAKAANLSFSTTTSGQAGHSAKYWGQLFTIPTGYSGTITSISNITLECYGSPTTPTGNVKIYTSRTKTTLLGTSTNIATLNSCPSGFGGSTNFTANFSGISVTAGQQYYFEFTFLTGSGNLYFYENFSASYSGGASYESFDGVTYSSGSEILKFTVNISASVSTPAFTSISPISGTTAGGTAVTITGTDFASGATVSIGGASATVTSVSSTQITATTPSGSAGTANVVVTNTDGGSVTSSGAYTYVNPPTITSLSVTSGIAAGGTSVTITGTNLTGTSGVTFGGTSGTSVTVVNSTTVTVTTPAKSAGAVDVALTTAGGTTTSAGAFTYLPAPTITSITPSTGSTAGGTTVTITGTNLSGVTGITFGGSAGSSISSNTSTSVTVVTPSGSAGAVNVALTGTNGSVTSSGGYTYSLTNGSIEFNGSNYLTVPSSSDWNFGTGDFTIEWWQNLGTQSSSAPRVFSFGCYPNSRIQASWETGYIWIAASNSWAYYSLRPVSATYSNVWSHFAIVRSSGTLKTYQNGIEIATTSNNSSLDFSASTLYLGYEGVGCSGTTKFVGKLTDFRIVKSAVYTGTFTPQTGLTAISNTVLLLNGKQEQFITDSSATPKTVTNVSSVASSSSYPSLPTISSIGTTSGSTAGGTSVTITGTNLSNVSSILFGSSAGTSITSNTSTSVTVTTPSGSSGAVNVTVTTAGGSAVSVGSYTYTAPTAPTLTGAAISGTATQGQQLTASVQGAGGDAATSTSYQWKSSSDNVTYSNISGATSSTYVLTSSEVGKYIKVLITVSNSVGSNSATSSATNTVAPIAPTISSATISGTKMSGQTLTATAGSLGGGAVASTTYQWKSSSDNSTYSDISGATSSTYQLTANEIGKYIKVVITVTNTAGSNSATSSATTTIASPTSTPGTVLYTTDYNSGLKKRALDGTGSQSALGSVTTGVELAASGSYIYIGYHQIRRIGTDGTGLTTLRTISDQFGLTINNGYIYYGYEYGKKIGRMDIDGSNANDSFMDFSAVSGVPYTANMTIVGSTLYFGGGGNKYGEKIWKVDVSGGTPTACITDNQGIGGITSDGTYIYWTNYRTGTVGRAALNCTGANASYITGVSYAWGIIYADGYLYFNHYTSGGYTAKVAADLHYINKTWVSNSSTQGIAIADGGAPVSLSSPTNSSIPTISGTATYSNTLTAGNGSWSGSPTSYTYQWSRASSSGGSYSNIAGATSSTYSIASADIGNYLKVTVTATNAAGSASSTSSATAQIGKATPTFSSWSNVSKYLGDSTYAVSAPTVTGSISGSLTYASSSSSVVSISGTTFTVAGVGTTTITATFTPSDTTLYNTATVTNTVSVLLPALTTPGSAPTVTLTTGATSSSITVTFTSVSNAASHTIRVYQSNGTSLVGSARTNFSSGSTITGLSGGTTYKVSLQGIGDGTNYSDSAESAQASITTAISPPTIGSATFSGTTTVGQTLTASANTVVGTVSSTTYQWKSSSTSGGAYTDISGATSNTYVLTSNEANKYIKVSITVSNSSGSNSATSNASAGAVVSTVATPTVSSVSPNAGTTAGGTTVTISGTNLSTVTDVTLGGTAATISSKTSTQLVFVTPAKSAGAVDLIITNSAGSLTKSNGYTFATTPTVRSWTTTPSITSGNVNDTFTVTYTAVCTTPQRYGPSMYDLIYYNNGSWAYNSYMGSGTSSDGGYTWTITKTYTLTATGIWKIDAYERGACWDSYNFTYAPRNYINVGVSGPTITSLTTTSGPTSGGTSTTITGTNLTGVTAITVGGSSATSIRSNTATSVTFNTPAGTAGAKNVVVTTAAGSVTSNNAFTYTAPITITYNVNGADSGSPSRTSDSYSPNTGGYSLPTVGTMIKVGHTFSGWATSNSSTTAITSPYNPTSTATVYAIWTAKSYTTTYNANGASSGSVPSSSSNNFGATVTVAGNSGSLARTGYTLAGWNTLADGTGTDYLLGSGQFTQGPSNLILYAEWIADTYSVAYDRNGSTDTAPTTQTGIAANGAVTLANAITKSGYAFVGWTENGVTYSAGATYRIGSADVTMVAKWIPVYTLSYSLNGAGATGSVPADFQYTSGDTVTVTATVPTRTGYNFGGWIDQSGGAHAASSTYAIGAGNYLLYGVWNPIDYTVTYALNGGSGTAPTETSKNYLATFTLASAPTRTGYTFTGWSDGSVVYGAGTTYTMPASNKTLTAQWSTNSYLITYDLAQGTSTVPSAVTKDFAATWTLPDLPTRVGYNFLDWYDGTSGYAAQANYTMATASNITITARWSAIVYYTVTYDLDGGLGTTPTQDPLQNGESFTLPSDPSKTGYSFTGWSYSNNAYNSGQTITMPASNITITATWTATSSGTYAITYIGNGSQTAVPTVPALAAGATFTVDDGSGLIKNGYIFSGWTYSGNTFTGGETVTMPSSSVTFSAVWVPSVRATAVSHSVDSTSVTRGRSITVTYNLGCYSYSSTIPTLTEKVTSTSESFINNITSSLIVVDAGYNWTVTRVYTLSAVGTYTITATASGGCFASDTDSTPSTVVVTEAPTSGGTSSSTATANNSGGTGASGSAITSIPPVTVVGARIALVANKYYTLPKLAPTTTLSVAAKAGASASTAPTTPSNGTTPSSGATTMLTVNSAATGLSEVKIVENQLAVVPTQGFSGKTTVSVTVTDGTTTSKIDVPVTVLPEPVKDPTLTPKTVTSTVVTWDPSPNATNYQVFVEGKSVCKTSGESCTIKKILGPNAEVEVVANGGDATKSDVVAADYEATSHVTVAKISGTYNRSTLSANDVNTLNKVIKTIKAQGFENVQITGITSTKLTTAAAKARLDAMIAYIKEKVDDPDLIVKVVAPTTRTFTNQIAVK